MGETINQHILRLRVEQAATRLKFFSWQVGETGPACGFQIRGRLRRALRLPRLGSALMRFDTRPSSCYQPNMDDKRIIELEEKLTYQEEGMTELARTVISLSRQVGDL
ncbi:MAG: hypothetical protein AAF492_20795, partial [Verrucomicrobiota bacterium]